MPSCLITDGRLEECKDSISGLQAVYFINYGIAPANVTYNTPSQPDEILSITGVTELYKYELKGANSFETTINSSRENGTTFFQQTLSIQLKKQDVTTHKNIKLLAYGRPHIVVHTRSNQWFLMGLVEGADVSAGTVSSGTQYGDFNGYSLTFDAMEKLPANFLQCADEDELATVVFDGANIVV
jgi:hypothetical protein